MSTLSTHVLDTSRGGPAVGVNIELKRQVDSEWVSLARGETNEDGRLPGCFPESIEAGTYSLRFDVATYFDRLGVPSFYPWAEVVFRLTAVDEHYHVPLLVSPFGYSTYRGS